MIFGSSRNGRLEVTQFSVPTISGTVSVIRRDALCKTSGLTSSGPMCKGHGWIFGDIIVGPSSIGLYTKDPASFMVKSLLKAFCYFDTDETLSANRLIDNPSLFQLGDISYWNIHEKRHFSALKKSWPLTHLHAALTSPAVVISYISIFSWVWLSC